MHVHLNIGSNLGDRENNLRRAVASLRQLAVDVSSVKVSDIVTSSPWGFDSEHDFMNVGMSFDTDMSPSGLLRATRAVEKSICDASHRDAAGGYIDRVIDIDLIAATDAAGEMIISTSPSLTLPHPRALSRPFVMTPLQQTDPELYHLLRQR